jgi:hypothetical protein
MYTNDMRTTKLNFYSTRILSYLKLNYYQHPNLFIFNYYHQNLFIFSEIKSRF